MSKKNGDTQKGYVTLGGASRFDKFLHLIERIGNRLPDPFILFFYLTVILLIGTFVLSLFDAAVKHPTNGDTVAVKTLFSTEGIRFILSDTITNFTSFAPLGLVIVIMLGIGLAEQVGLLEVTMKQAILATPKKIITFAVFFIGIMANIASDAAFVVVPPLAALAFLAVNRHPMAGLAAGLAATGIGFTANLMVAGTDVLLSGIATEVAKGFDPNAHVSPLDNWYFMSVSTFVLATVGTIVSEKYLEPRLGTYKGKHAEEMNHHIISALEKKGMRNALIAIALYVLVIIVITFIPHSPFLNDDGTFLRSPLLNGIVPILFGLFLVAGITYGVTVKKITSTKDIPALMTAAVKDLSGYIVLVFMIAQFVAFFNWTNLSTWLAVHFADLLEMLSLTNMVAIILFVLLVALLSLFIISGSALWALVAPIFIPTFMALGYHPAFIQVAYRVGESSTNMMTPLNPYFAIILTFLQVYDKKAGLGTLISLMIPYTIAFLTVWIILLLIFGLFNLPIGPGIFMKM